MMRLPSLLRGFALLLWLCGGALSANASHIWGAELTYEYAGTAASPHQYHVVARLVRELNSVVMEPSVMLTCGRNECGNALPGSFVSMLTRTDSTPISAGCAGTGLSFELTVLEGLVVLPPAHWTLSINLSNRQVGVVNVLQSQLQSIYVQAELDNTSGLRNSSPRFTTTRVIQLAGAQGQRYSASAFDSEGDSLTYQLVSPMAAPVTPAACGYATSGPIAPHFQLDAASGELLTVAGPAQQGMYALAVRVSEYRRVNGAWQPIGSISRDQNYLVAAGTNQAPAFSRVAATDNPGGQLLGQTIRVSPGQALSLTLTATDPDVGQGLTLGSNVGAIVPGAAFQPQGNGQALLTWQVPATQPPGRYILTATAFDTYCPVAGYGTLTIPVLVTRQALAAHAAQALAQLPFPVPFQDEVRFQLAGTGRRAVTIVDELGRSVAHLTTAADGSVAWRPAPGLAAGLYFARSQDGSQVARLSYGGR